MSYLNNFPHNESLDDLEAKIGEINLNKQRQELLRSITDFPLDEIPEEVYSSYSPTPKHEIHLFKHPSFSKRRSHVVIAIRDEDKYLCAHTVPVIHADRALAIQVEAVKYSNH